MAYIEERRRTDGGTSWRVCWRDGGSRDGARCVETFTRSRAHAEAFKADVEAAGQHWPPGWVKGQGYVAEAPSVPTFAEVGEAFFAEQKRRVARGKLTEYTVHRYGQTWRNHLLSAFGDLPITEIGHDEIADWIDGEIEAGWAPKSIRNWHGLLFSIMEYAQQRLGARPDNPCATTELPENLQTKQVRFFQHGEWTLLRSCLKRDVHLLVDVLLATGMRWGEISALRVSDLAFSKDGDQTVVSLHIQRAWTARGAEDSSPIRVDEGENESYKIGPTKSRRPRFVVVVGELADRVARACDGRGPREYVFVTSRGNPWRYKDFHSDRWLPAVAAARERGLDKHATPHMLRHTAVVWSLAEGIPIQVVSEMLGHASIQITYDVYGGLIDVKDPTMARAMARAMMMAGNAIVPRPSEGEVEARPVRPGRRGEKRRRVG